MPEYIVQPSEDGMRLDVLLTQLTGLSRSAAQKLLFAGQVTVGNEAAPKNGKVKTGDRLFYAVPEAQPCEIVPQEIPLNIVYEDPHLLVVNKEKGLVVHPAPGNPDGTLVNALLAHCGDSLSGINGVQRPGIVHRIDKDTSGLLMVAKTDAAHRSLAEQISIHSFYREYAAVVVGSLKEDQGRVDKPIGRHPVNRKKMAVVPNGRDARTNYTVLARFPGYTLVKLVLETGRTHQIRVHMASLGHPVAGDVLYGAPRGEKEFPGQCLHARAMGFVHPISGENLFFSSELPDYFAAFLRRIGGKDAEPFINKE